MPNAVFDNSTFGSGYGPFNLGVLDDRRSYEPPQTRKSTRCPTDSPTRDAANSAFGMQRIPLS
jgi:hypothetical protein